MGKSRDLFKKIKDTKGTFHAKMGSIKDRNSMDLKEAEEDGGGVRWGGCQPPHKYIKNSLRYGTTPTKQPLGDSRKPQDFRGAG